VEVLRLGDVNTTASVNVTTADATATAGQDFEALSVESRFGPGETSQIATVNILEDDQAEGPEHFIVSRSSPSAGSALNLRSSATVTIQDDEPGLVFATTNVVVMESALRAEVIVRRTGRTDQQVSVRCAVNGGTASEGVDFEPMGEVLDFAVGETEKAILFAPIDDRWIEPDETCQLFLSEAQGETPVPPVTALVQILDDERPGSVDLAFNQGSSPNNWVFALALRPDQRILCGGWFTEVGGAMRTALVQYLSDGQVDPGFAPVEFRKSQSPEAQLNPASIYRIAVQDDGKILVAGSFASVHGYPRNHVARLMPDGAIDQTFAPAPGPDSQVWDVLQQPDGKILIAGSFRSVSGWASGLIARLNPDGSVDKSFQAIPRPRSGRIGSMVLRSNGKIIVGGFFAGFGSDTGQHLMILEPDGEPATTRFRLSRPDGAVRRVIANPDGSILIAGVFSRPKEKLYRIGPDGRYDVMWTASPAVDGTIIDLAVQADGSIVIAGEFRSTATQNRSRVARLRVDGELDTVFDAGSGPNDSVWALGLQANGWVVIGGMFTEVNGASCPHLARLRSDGTRPTFAAPVCLRNGEVALKLFGNAGSTYLLESSTDLLEWIPVWTNTFSGPSWEWTEPEAFAGQRFYRSVVP